MVEMIEAGGIAPGGINFDAKVRRTSFEMEDLVLAHIAGMDTFARGFKSAVRMKEDKFLENIKAERYESFTEGIGKDIVDGKATLESLSDYAMKNQDITNKSSHIEIIKSKINDYVF